MAVKGESYYGQTGKLFRRHGTSFAV